MTERRSSAGDADACDGAAADAAASDGATTDGAAGDGAATDAAVGSASGVDVDATDSDGESIVVASDTDGTDADALVARYAVSADATETEFLAAAKLYARAVADRHDLAVSVTDLEWSVSKRAKRRAGVVKYTDDEPEAVVLTWDHFTEHGWAAAAGTIRHELIHVHLLNEAGDGGHGEAFERVAERVDAPVHCERFTDPKWWVTCTDCEARIARYRRSKLVEQPEEYCCADCGGAFRVVRND